MEEEIDQVAKNEEEVHKLKLIIKNKDDQIRRLSAMTDETGEENGLETTPSPACSPLTRGTKRAHADIDDTATANVNSLLK